MKALTSTDVYRGHSSPISQLRRHIAVATFATLTLLSICIWFSPEFGGVSRVQSYDPSYRKRILEQCRYTQSPAGPPIKFSSRKQSDRFVPGTPPVLLKNAKIWTGARNGTELVRGDLLLDKGVIKALGYIPPRVLNSFGKSLVVQDVKGAWVTPGLFDLHSHIGVQSLPFLRGANDGNSRKAPILPWLRSIDGLNTHDASYELAISGGVTTAQILPGSANSIGGQSFVIKLSSTKERSATSKVVEPPYTLNGSHFDHSLTPRWRHMKHACGENPSRVYSQTRMDSAWGFRSAYNEARKIKDKQDSFCAKAEAGLWDELSGEFPEDLQWEALVDVLRGKVKLSIHCYEAVDLDAIVRLSNEFEFPVASFHHAGETYLVPDLLKKTWGGVPSIALFASNARKKKEAYRGSEFAPRVLAGHGIPVVMKSDHPVVNSRYLLHEATLAHYYGLHPSLALASVTSVPAAAAGLGHRLGTVKEGYDADIVVWDSHPLTLGATPTQVYIDGIPQLSSSFNSTKPNTFQHRPETPNFDHEAEDAVKYEGLPPLEPRGSKRVALINVGTIYTKKSDRVEITHDGEWSVLVQDGTMVCIEQGSGCLSFAVNDTEIIDIRGGSIAPGLTTFGSPLGLVEIRLEPATNDGVVYDAVVEEIPSILGGEKTVIRAVDGLQFGGRNTLLAYRGGVTTAISAPSSNGFSSGISTAFSVGARNGLAKNAILQQEVALHVHLGRGYVASVSTQVATLRRLLFKYKKSHDAWKRVQEGTIPLVAHVENADIMSTLLLLKAEYEEKTNRSLKLTFAGATEAHLLAKEIGQAGVSVVLSPARPFPMVWDQSRILPGPPLTNHTSVTLLLEHNVNVAIGTVDEYDARNTRLDIAWAALESSGRINKAKALSLATTNLDRALGLDHSASCELVVYKGGDILDIESKVIGVLAPRRGVIDLF